MDATETSATVTFIVKAGQGATKARAKPQALTAWSGWKTRPATVQAVPTAGISRQPVSKCDHSRMGECRACWA
jgi:hypothetical protein